MGHVVKARISLDEPEDRFQLAERLRKFSIERMAKYKVPVKYEIVHENDQRNMRFKKTRS
jgi:hypothetical protein